MNVTALRLAPRNGGSYTITPKEAEAIILRHKDLEAERDRPLQRPLNRDHVNHLSKQLRDGKHVADVATVVLSVAGRVLNGNHTLHAIVQSDVAATVLFNNIVPIEREELVFRATDIGRRRTPAQMVKFTTQSKNPALMAATARYILAYEYGKMSSTSNFSTDDILRFSDDNKDKLENFIDFVKARKLKLIFPETNFVSWIFIIDKAGNPIEETMRFFEIVSDKKSDELETHPARILREACILRKKTVSAAGSQHLNFYGPGIQAWNAFATGTPCPVLTQYDASQQVLEIEVVKFTS